MSTRDAVMSRKEVGQLTTDIRNHGELALTGIPLGELRSRTHLTDKRAARLHDWATTKRTHAQSLGVSTTRGRVHLVVGDAHAKAGVSNRRFKWLGKMVADLEPDAIIQLGDWYDLPSQCKPAAFRERIRTTLKDDIEAGVEALEFYHDGLGMPRAPANVQHTITEGNHDYRLAKLAENEPWMEGFFEIAKEHTDRGWKWVPFLEPYRLDGVAYQHYVTNEMGRAVSGVYQARNSLMKTEFKESLVVGHSHVYQQHTAVSRGVRSLVAGCYFEHHEDYAGASNDRWWRGVFVLNEVHDGNFSIDEWPMERVKRRYG